MQKRKTRIKWENVTLATMTAVFVVFSSVNAYHYITRPAPEIIEYQKEVEQGETVWSICSKIATDKEDLAKLVWQTCKDNHIEDPGNIQPGMLLIVRVKEARAQK